MIGCKSEIGNQFPKKNSRISLRNERKTRDPRTQGKKVPPRIEKSLKSTLECTDDSSSLQY